MKLYRNFSTQEEIDNEYNIGASSPNIDNDINWYIKQSEITRTELDCNLDVRFGPTIDETVDIFPSKKPNSPILVFIHGGYWRMLSSKEFSYVAKGFVQNNVTVVITNYSLCPKVTIAEITRQSRAVISWLHANAENYNGDRDKIIVAGHSAGGQQAAIVAATDWQTEYGLDNNIIKGIIPISGVFDLEPLRYSYLQPVLMLSHEIILHQSPILNLPSNNTPILITLGEGDLPEFHRQAREYHDACKNKGIVSEYYDCTGKDHFTVINDLIDPKSEFVSKILSMY